ncbi:hypothetical protein Indivirus_5_34 [Indivirus ILV1]|uniref:Uncharacterized protein n=1 Tax=Indivirus ILV1 TaxID=1977633 RepID=A0A1V0SDZ4_9VIRU|nr:hypothetical protein Indivirus_5_34 [Indivirus ILV1]
MNIIIDKSNFNGTLVHLVFNNQDTMNKKIGKISERRESNKKVIYKGHNFPGCFLDFDVGVYEENFYVIAYIENDQHTKQHELYHAKYYFDTKYRNKVNKLWNSLSCKKRNEITAILNNMGYREEFHLDEFQAYLYSEPLRKNKNFWNIDS